jgi:O-antigen ligase
MINLVSNLFSFLFIFSIFNDNFVVEIFNSLSLKIIFVLFVLFNLPKIISSFKYFSNIHKIFYSLIFVIFLVTMINTIQEEYFLDFLLNSTILLIAIIIIFTFYSQADLEKTLNFIWISISISVIICYFNEPISEWTFRTTGGTGDPNEFATHLLIYIFLSIYLYKTYKNLIYLVIGLPFFTYGILMASSKSSFLVLGVLLILLSFSKIKNILNYKTIILILILIFAISSIDFSKFELILNAISRFETNNTASHRLDSWIAGYNLIENNFLTGIGMDEYANTIMKYSSIYLDPGSRAPHNVYLALIAENGIFVLVLFLFFLFTIFRENFFYLFRSEYIFIQFMYLSLFLMAFTLGIQYDKYTWLIIAIYSNILFSIKKEKL